jgi:hypothetical protein
MPHYKIEIEIYEGQGGQLRKKGDQIIYPASLEKEGICAWMYRGDRQTSYQVGYKFVWPDDVGKICPWLVSSMDSFIKTLVFGGTLGWRYKDTPYEKVIDPHGITTEFIRCPDPTASGIVVKLTRTKIGD